MGVNGDSRRDVRGPLNRGPLLCCWPKRVWGATRKGTKAFWAEHVFVLEDELYLGVTEPSDVQQRFVSTWRGTSIQNEEFVDDAKFTFTVAVDDITADIFDRDLWGELWTRAEMLGIGATRSQGFGRFSLVRWEEVH